MYYPNYRTSELNSGKYMLVKIFRKT